MVENVKAGTKYRVISVDENFFNPGDVVVALDYDNCPYCVLEETFKKNNHSLSIFSYKYDEIACLYSSEIEEIEEEQKLEISKMLTISTSHITPEANEGILYAYYDDDKNVSAPVYSKDGYGWFIYIDEEFEKKTNPECLKDCMRLAKENGCDWLCLDSDGPVVDGLPVYKWDKEF